MNCSGYTYYCVTEIYNMKYSEIIPAKFIERPNRFIAYVDIAGERTKVHVKNTGRCRELLKEQAQVYLEKSDNPNRSTAYDLVAVRKDGRMVNMDSGASVWYVRRLCLAIPDLIFM